MGFSAHKEKAQKEYVPEDPESDPSLSDSSLIKSDCYDDSKYKIKRRDKNNNYQKLRKQDSSDSSPSKSDQSEKIDYKIKRRKKKKYRKRKKRDPIKLCAKLTARLLKTAHKLKVLKLKLCEDPLHRRI